MKEVKVSIKDNKGMVYNVDGSCKIKWNIESNVKRWGSKSFDRMDLYIGCSNVGEIVEKGGIIGDIKNDFLKGFFKIDECIKSGKKVKV